MKSHQPIIQWHSIPFVRLSLFFMAGILFHIHSDVLIPHAIIIFGSIVLLYSSFIFLGKKQLGRKLPTFFGLLAFLILFLFGYCLTGIRTAARQKNHLIHQKAITSYEGKIVSAVQEKTKSWKAVLEVNRIYQDSTWQSVSGKVILYFSKKDTSLHLPHYGDRLVIHGSPQQISAPNNPNEFNYQRYLAFRQIHHQHFLNKKDFIQIGHQPDNQIFKLSLSIQQKADQLFKTYIRHERAYSIVTALILGVKDHLDQDTKAAYASAGAMHVLAVSGLHVGILLQVLTILLGKLKKIRWGNGLFTIVLLLALWLYAFLTGLSPSVLRAVTMFSFVIVGKALNRRTNIYNTLALSAFVLLCWNPYLIMEVGFQLSYIAVVGIVYLSPKMMMLWQVKHWLKRQVWEITCVSIAAQIATFPIGLLYFHQFPTYFWLSNLVVIYAATFILYLGLALLFVGSWFTWFAAIIGSILQFLVNSLNEVVFYIQNLPHALIDEIDLELTDILLIYSLILLLILFIRLRKLKYLAIATCSLLMLTSLQLVESHEQNHQKKLIVYHTKGHSNICFINGRSSYFLADTVLLAQDRALSFHVKQDFWKMGLQNQHWYSFNNDTLPLPTVDIRGNPLFIWEGKRVLLYQHPVEGLSLKVDYLIIGHNAVTSWEEIGGIQASYIILDASNISYRIKNLSNPSEKALHSNLHNVKKQGAFVKHFK